MSLTIKRFSVCDLFLGHHVNGKLIIKYPTIKMLLIQRSLACVALNINTIGVYNINLFLADCVEGSCCSSSIPTRSKSFVMQLFLACVALNINNLKHNLFLADCVEGSCCSSSIPTRSKCLAIQRSWQPAWLFALSLSLGPPNLIPPPQCCATPDTSPEPQSLTPTRCATPQTSKTIGEEREEGRSHHPTPHELRAHIHILVMPRATLPGW